MPRVHLSILSFAVVGVIASPHAGAAVIAESSFDTGLEGWTVSASAEWRSSGGNPGGYLFGVVVEPLNLTSLGSAPAEFLGDWSSLDGVGRIEFDYIRISNGGSATEFLPLRLVISGPGGQARWHGPVITTPTPWTTYTADIDEADWEIISGSWAAIVVDVQLLTIQLELVSNSSAPDDEAGADNFRLIGPDAPACPGDINGDGFTNAADFTILAGNFGSAVPAGTAGDLNNDGLVNAADFVILAGDFGCP